MDKSILIVYSDIIGRATELSAFEAKQAVNTNGESMFGDVRIYDKDATALLSYIKEGARLMEARLATSFSLEATTSTDCITWTFKDIGEHRISINADKFTEAFVAYTLARWLENKIPNTAQAYIAMFKDLSEAAIKIAKTKRKPTRPS